MYHEVRSLNQYTLMRRDTSPFCSFKNGIYWIRCWEFKLHHARYVCVRACLRVCALARACVWFM